MRVLETDLPGVLLIEPKIFRDDRGWFTEAWRAELYEQHGIPTRFAQDSLSWSQAGVLRGLHLQVPRCQGKLVSVLRGEVFDVAVDVRRGSPTFGRWTAATLSDTDLRQMWIPPGFAHGFLVTGREALVAYKSTEPYDPNGQVAIRWDDPDLGIAWGSADPRLNLRDSEAPRLADVDPARLPGVAD